MTTTLLFLPLILIIALCLLFFGIGLILKTKDKLFAVVLGILLLGYLIGGKAFAYLGFAPLYVSELTLALGCATVFLTTLVNGRLYIGAVKHASALWLCLFVFWGALRTVPYIPEYGLEALRDGVIWGYAIIAFCAAFVMTRSTVDWLFGCFSRLLPFLLVWPIVAFILIRYVALPNLAAAGTSIFFVKPGDVGVFLSGAAAFMLLRLDRHYGRVYKRWHLWLFWAAWGASWIVVGSKSRGAMLSALFGVIVAFLFRPQFSGWIRPAIMVALLLFGLLVGELTGSLQNNPNARRETSIEQLATNITSLLGGRSMGDQEGTLEFRLSWWSTIAGYTFGGPYLFTGKGFGINLAQDDGFPSPAGVPPNRHPHNITMNILARAGVPGLVLWLFFLITYGLRLFTLSFRQGIVGRTAIWLLSYWLAFLFNAQVDVFLEGPMGGIWFWALVGITWVYIYRKPRPITHPVPVLLPERTLAQDRVT